MERKEIDDRERRAGLDSPEQASAPVADDATGGGTDGVVGSPWWESGLEPGEAAGEEPDTYTGTGYIYRGVRYGEAVPEPESQPTDPTNAAVMSEDQPPVFPAEGEEANERGIGVPWWQAGSRLEEAAGEEPGAESEAAETPLGADDVFSGTGFGEPLPEPGTPAPETPEDGNDPVELFIPAAMSEDRPAVPPAEGEEANEPIVAAPWWQADSRLEEAAGEEPGAESEAAETPLGADDAFSGTGYAEPLPEPETPAPEEPDDGDDPVDLAAPATMPADPPAVAPAEEEQPPGAEAREEPAALDREPDREPPSPAAGLPVATEGLPERPPAELIRSIVAEVCPGELLLVEAAAAPLPEWADAAVTGARNDLDRRSRERQPIDAGEYLRLAIVENATGRHDEADAHLKEALPRSDRFGPVLNALAVTSLARGKIAPAIVYCKEALRETGGDDSVRAAASSNLGDLYDLQGDAVRATEAYETAIQCLQAREDPGWLSRLHLRAGRLYRRLGQADQARLHLSDSVRLFKDSGDQAGQVQSLAALGSALTESGSHDLALRNFEEAVRICLRTGDKPGAALVQDELGAAYMAQDQLTRALAYFESALSLHRELGNRKAEAAALSKMAKIHDSRGDLGEARQLYEAALEIDPEVGRTGRPHPESGGHGGARDKLLQAEEILNRAESAEQQEYVQRMIEKPGPGTESLG